MSDQIMKALDGLEAKLATMSTKADEEMKTLGKVTTDTKTALDNIGIEQREFADRLLKLEQTKSQEAEPRQEDGYGEQFTKSSGFENFVTADAHGRVWGRGSGRGSGPAIRHF